MYKNLEHGQWLFTCDMKPQQFKEYIPLNAEEYGNISKMSEEELHYFKYDNFLSIQESSHSQTNCGCKLISEKYALWFLENKIYELHIPASGNEEEKNEIAWKNYIEKVKYMCEKANLEFEGV